MTMATVISIQGTLEASWGAYVEAKSKADLTGSMEDGRKAAKAWRRWLDLHMTEDQRAYLGDRGVRL